MAVSVQSDLMALLSNGFAVFRERLERVAWNEEGRLDVVFIEHLQEPLDANGAGEQTTGDVRRRVFTAV